MLRFLINLLLDSTWGFIFLAVGVAWAVVRSDIPLSRVMESSWDVLHLVGVAVLIALILYTPAWALNWLERKDSSGDPDQTETG